MNRLERMVIGLVVILTVAGMWTARSPHQVTVPQAVLYDGHARQTERMAQVERWAQDELSRIMAQGFILPPLTVTVVPAYGWNGATVISQEPTRYTVLIVAWFMPTETEVRRVTAHEAAHVLLDMAGLPNTEANADLFAACFGTNGNPKGEGCKALRDGLRGGEKHGA